MKTCQLPAVPIWPASANFMIFNFTNAAQIKIMKFNDNSQSDKWIDEVIEERLWWLWKSVWQIWKDGTRHFMKCYYKPHYLKQSMCNTSEFLTPDSLCERDRLLHATFLSKKSQSTFHRRSESSASKSLESALSEKSSPNSHKMLSKSLSSTLETYK